MAQVLGDLAAVRPRMGLVLLPHLESEPHVLLSVLILAVGHLVPGDYVLHRLATGVSVEDKRKRRRTQEHLRSDFAHGDAVLE